MTATYEPTPDPRENPSRYAFLFTNRDAAEYAAEFLDHLDPDEFEDLDRDDSPLDDWAHETADGLAAVIYTGRAVALYASGLLDDEDAVADYLDGLDSTDSATAIIDRLITVLSYEWHRRILRDAVESLVEERREAAGDDDDLADEVTA
jgi:hypothetical protein